MRAFVAAAAALLVAVGTAFATAGPAEAGPVDNGWSAGGPGAVTVSDGTDAAAAMTYNADGAGSASWTFTARATQDSANGPIKVPYTWQGLHAWFKVTADLVQVVNGIQVGTLVHAGPANCCTSPSNGFLYGGVATFNVSPGDTYGFRLSGSNFDSNNFLHGTFTLSTKPYLDATIGQDNRQWLGAEMLPLSGLDGSLDEAGEARWYRFPVVPGQKVTVGLSALPRDYDLALYGDIQTAFDLLSSGSDVTRLAAASAAGAPGSGTQVPEYDPSITQVPTSEDTLPSTTFAPRIYAPRIYAPRIYAPRIYAPRIYAPRIYAPRIYAPDSYVPDLGSDPAFRDAFSAAQNQTLLAVSANTGTQDETVSASTGNTDGFFYVRVQGHDDEAFDPNTRFHLSRSVEGGEDCADLSDFAATPTLGATRTDADAVIVTDTNKLGLAEGSPQQAAYLGSLGELAAATDGAVVDVHDSARVLALQQQVAEHPACPYATNLVARAIKQIVDSYRGDGASLRYVVLAGGDEVIPFFRYPDVSGLGQESQFEPPMQPDSPAGASLESDQVLSQDAYGSRNEVTIGGSAVPVPDLAVGRLVKTPDEIQDTVDHYLGLDGGTLPAPTSSLVTGYDFLEDAATQVGTEFAHALPDGTHDTLIEPSGTPHALSWNATDLENALFGRHHDLLFLAGHFSANDTLAADFETTFDADKLDPAVNPGKLADTVVLSAGCHSGYNIVDGQATEVTNTFDWTQRLAEQHAVLIGGTGYQYGDTDFLEYSERLYLEIARRLHAGPPTGDAPPVAVGNALTLAKQDYLASLGTLTGIDQKAVLEATLYGLPMTGFDAPGRTPIGSDVSQADPTPVTAGPGQTLGLGTDDLHFATPTDRHSKQAPEAVALGLPGELSWRNGADGVSVQPGAPALPKQVENVSVPAQVLRGVGFRGGDYSDTPGLLPLTGAPAIEGATANSTFSSPAFFPQRLATANYFGALGASGRTSLILTPDQFRNDDATDPNAPTNTERAYSGMDVRLFYSGATSTSFGDNQPALAAPPGIGDVVGTLSGGQVTFSARVTGDPSAGVQQVWVTWTGTGSDSGHGHWRSVDLTQSEVDSTQWSGTFDLPAGQSRAGMRFIVQAANGIGAVGLDTAEGDGYRVSEASDADTATVALQAGPPSPDSPLGVRAVVTDESGQALADRTVEFIVLREGSELFRSYDTTDADGGVTLQLPDGQGVPPGVLTIVGSVLDAQGQVSDTDQLVLDLARVSLTAGTPSPGSPLGVTATVTDGSGSGAAGRTVRFTVSRASTPDAPLYTVERTTGSDGTVAAPGDASGRVPAGRLRVTAALLDLSGNVKNTASTEVVVGGVVVAPTFAFLTTRAGKPYILPLRVRLSDAFGPLGGVAVTFTLPTSGASASFPPATGSTVRRTAVTVVTGSDGVATSPIPTAGTTIGTFAAAVSAEGGTPTRVPMAAQYAFSPFRPPVDNSGVTPGKDTVSVRTTALLPNDAALADASAAALVASQRVQIRWLDVTSLGPWKARTDLAKYDAGKDEFHADLKSTSLGMVKDHTYLVMIRILPAASDVKPDAYDAVNSLFDLGNRSFLLKATK